MMTDCGACVYTRSQPGSLATTSTNVRFSVKMNETSENNPQYPVSGKTRVS